MAEIPQKSWTSYPVGKRSTRKNWVEASCQTLSVVSHVTHVHNALEVLRVGSIKPQLIYDESRLNTKRVLVVWLSPNDWSGAGGFQYGNISFDLSWKKLIRDKHFYWIGAMEYSPTACRILITEKDRDEKLMRHVPSRGDGPWWDDEENEKHYWNGNLCLEFMLEEEIPLSSISKLNFVKHHNSRCSISPQSCPDRRHRSELGAARLLAGACGRRLLSRRPRIWVEDDKPKECLLFAWRQLHERLCHEIQEWDAAVKATTEKAAAVARAGMGALCDQSSRDLRHPFGLFKSEKAVIEACGAVIERDLNLESHTLPRAFDEPEF
jgi:hypothetical protein